ncbi:MAG: hypothetical protein PHC33_03950, partial [Candidatus Omnitrophica bacterium]|nr:hypothetical protein [Candidatus Omnitrophota bacterium]
MVQRLRVRTIALVLWFTFFSFAGGMGVNTFLVYAQDSTKEEESFYVARKAFDDGFYDVALSLLKRFQDNYPSSGRAPEVSLLIGQCYFNQNKFLDALNKFEETLNRSEAKAIQDAL